MTETRHKPDKRALLKDLEDIRESLRDKDYQDDDIPILTDSVGEGGDATVKASTPVEPAAEDKPGLFDEKLIFDEVEGEGEIEAPVAGQVDEYIDELDASSDEETMLRAAYRSSLSDSGLEPSPGPAPTRASHVLEGQQSLFDEDIDRTGIRQSVSVPDETSAPVLPSAVGDNPFLPKHIRERLTKGKNSFLEEIALVNESLSGALAKSGEGKPEIRAPQKPASKTPAEQEPGASRASAQKSQADYQKIVDEVVAEFLPQIESALRKRMTQIVENEKPGKEK